MKTSAKNSDNEFSIFTFSCALDLFINKYSEMEKHFDLNITLIKLFGYVTIKMF